MLSKNMADLDTVSPVVWPKWCYTNNHADNGAAVPHVALCKAPASSIKSTRRKKAVRTAQTAGVKNERCSPDPEIGTESSRSDSPHSPCSSSFRTRTPSFPGTPPNPPFTPPERFSPASNLNSSGGNKLMMEGVHMSRNYSDFMRSLAAKYNNANPNEYRNGYMPVAAAMDSRFNSYKASAASAFPLLNLPLGPLGPAVAAAAAKKDLEAAAAVAAAAAAAASGSGSKKSESPTMPLSLPALMGGLNPAGLPAGLPGFPMIDMSSTQALLNIVRSASAQNAQQLESYLRGSTNSSSVASTKRSADTASLASSSPLDLSASMAKRPHLEPVAGSGFRDLFGLKSPAVETNEIAVRDRADIRSAQALNGKSPPSRAPSVPSFPAPLLSQTSPRSAEKREPTPKFSSSSSLPIACRLTCAADSCTPGAVEVKSWTVSDVVDFVKSIDLCVEYAEVFREHSIDGCTLPLLTEEHLIGNMNMKLGPALKLRSVLAKKIGHCAICLHCVHCHSDPTASGQQSPVREQETGAEI